MIKKITKKVYNVKEDIIHKECDQKIENCNCEDSPVKVISKIEKLGVTFQNVDMNKVVEKINEIVEKIND